MKLFDFVVDLWSYLEELHKLVGNLYERMSRIQDNLKEMKLILTVWSNQPLFERKEGKKVRENSEIVSGMNIVMACVCSK